MSIQAIAVAALQTGALTHAQEEQINALLWIKEYNNTDLVVLDQLITALLMGSVTVV
jgi:hypothetical protein